MLLFNGLLVVFIQQEDMLYTDYQIAISSFCDFWGGRWKGSQDIPKQVSDFQPSSSRFSSVKGSWIPCEKLWLRPTLAQAQCCLKLFLGIWKDRLASHQNADMFKVYILL